MQNVRFSLPRTACAAQRQRDEAENRARNAQSDLATAQAQSANVSSNDNRRTEAAEEEVERLRALVAKQAATLEEKIRALASKEVGMPGTFAKGFGAVSL